MSHASQQNDKVLKIIILFWNWISFDQFVDDMNLCIDEHCTYVLNGINVKIFILQIITKYKKNSLLINRIEQLIDPIYPY